MQTQKSKIDTGKALDADLVDTESIRTDSTVQDDSSRSGNDTDADDADIRPIYDEEPMAEVQLTAECNIFAIGLLHMEQPESLLRENNLLDLILGGNLQVEFSNLLVLDIPHIMNPNNSDVSEGTSINDQEGTRLVLSAVVLKSSAVTATDASNKRQQQHDSTSSTSTLAITVTANGNFDFPQGVSNDVLVSIEGVEELQRNVWIKGEKKEALLTP
ncbi:hypothetical protein Tco_1326192 [Tanacetum coccineum]